MSWWHHGKLFVFLLILKTGECSSITSPFWATSPRLFVWFCWFWRQANAAALPALFEQLPLDSPFKVIMTCCWYVYRDTVQRRLVDLPYKLPVMQPVFSMSWRHGDMLLMCLCYCWGQEGTLLASGFPSQRAKMQTAFACHNDPCHDVMVTCCWYVYYIHAGDRRQAACSVLCIM